MAEGWVRILAVIVSLLILRVGPTEVAVVYQPIGGNPANGSLWPEPLGPGTYLIVPIVNVPTVYSTQRSVYTLAEGDAVSVESKDSRKLSIEISIVYSVNPTTVNILHSKWGAKFLATYVRPTVRRVLTSYVATFTEAEFARQVLGEQREIFGQRINIELANDFQQNGLVLGEALIRNIWFSPDFIATIEAQQIAEATATAQAGKR